MKKSSLFLITLLLLPLLGLTGQEIKTEQTQNIDDLNVLKSSDRDSLLAWQENIMLHLAENVVQPKGVLFYKAYLLTGPQRRKLNLSKVMRVELVGEDGEVLKTQYHPIADGESSGNLKIPKKINAGKYSLRAYTRWMQNYGEDSYAEKSIYVGKRLKEKDAKSDKPIAIQVVSEGGGFINGLRNRIVLRIEHADGSALESELKIIDEDGSTVSEVIGYEQGLFTASFTPEEGKEYRLIFDDGRSYPMPKATNDGYLVMVNNLDSGKSRIRVMVSANQETSKLFLVGEIGGIKYLEKEVMMGDGTYVDFEYSKKNIPRGVMILKLIDGDKNEMAWRPIWVDGDGVNIEIVPLVAEQQPGSEHAFQILVTDAENKPVESVLALGVKGVDALGQGMPKMEFDSDSFDFFPVNSATHEMENANPDRKERFLNDINLLVNSKEIYQKDKKGYENLKEIKYPFQEGLDLGGLAYDMDNNLLKQTAIQVMAFSEGQIWVKEYQTDAKGRLYLRNLPLEGETDLVFRTKGDASESRLVKLIEGTWLNDKKKERQLGQNKKKKRAKEFEPEAWNNEDAKEMIDLDEVVVKEKPQDNPSKPSVYNIEPTRVRYQDIERPKTIPQLLMDIPGVYVRGLGSINPTVTVISGYGPVLWVIDGAPISQGGVSRAASTALVGGGTSNSLVDIISLVPFTDVERIELLTGADAAVFGTRSSGGVFLIYTRSGSELSTKERKKAQMVFQGYEPEINFQEYRRQHPIKNSPGFRTLYWNPRIQTNQEGKAIVRFTTPEPNANFHIQLSTVTEEGKVGYLSAVLSQ